MSAPSGEEEEPIASGTVIIHRPTYDELQFEETFHPLGYQRLKLSIAEPIRSHIMPPLSLKEWREFLLVRLPILRWLWEYRHPLLFGDVISGVTVGIMHIPQGMAYAVLANVPPVYGLYVSFLPPLVYSLFGTSRQISIGTLAITCLMVGDALSDYIDDNPSLCELVKYNETTGKNRTIELDLADCPAALDVVFTITFVTGLIMIIFGALQFGFITIFLSDALVSGYTTGAAVHVFSSQLRHIFGLSSSSVKVEPGLFQLPQKWLKILDQVFSGNTNWVAVIIAVLCISFLIIMKVINKQFYKIKLYRKVPIPIPSQLIVVIVATAISAGFSLQEKQDIMIVDHIPTGLPPFTPPKPTYMLPILLDSFVIAVVSYSIAISLSKVFAKKHGYTIVPNQELLAHGITNFVTSFFSCFVSTCSLSRSVIQDTTGGNTQLVSFISSSILIIVLLWVGPLFEPLPTAVLASIIVVALYGMFKQVKDIHKYYKLCVPDMMVWIVVFIATVLLGVDVGLLVGIEFSLFLIVMRLVLPTAAVLGKAGDTEIYRDQLYFSRIQQIPGVLIFRFIAPLCYTNVSVFKSQLAKASGINPALCGTKKQPKGCLELASNKIVQTLPSGTKFRHRRLTDYDNHDDDDDDDVTIETNHIQDGVQLNVSQLTSDRTIHSIVLDMAPVTFIDSAGASTIKYIVSCYSTCNVQVLLAATTKNNRDMLTRSGFMDEFGKEWLFPSIEDAVTFAAGGNRVGAQSSDYPDNTMAENISKQKQKVQDADPTSYGLPFCLASLWSVLSYCIFWGPESGCSCDGDGDSKYGGGGSDDDIPLPAAINQTKEFHDMCKSPRTYTLTSKTAEKLKIPVYQLGAINRELHNLLSTMSNSGRMSINPGGLLSKINESGDGKVFDANQQDAHELLRHLLQHLKDEEIKIIQNEVRNYSGSPLSEELMSEYLQAANKGVTLIDQNIGGKCVNTIICRECLKPVQLTEPFFDISLSIPDQLTKTEKRNEVSLITRRHTAIAGTDLSHAINTDINSAGGLESQTVVTASDLRSPPILEAHINPKVATEFTTLQQYLHNEGLHYHPPSPARSPSTLGLEQSLHNYTDIDVLDDDNRFICNNCNRNNCLVSKQIMILQLQNVLILHIKRFNIGDIAVTKNNKFLSFSQLLDMAPYCSDKCLQHLKDKNDQILYGLYAVVVHRGRRLRSGHYVAYVRVRPNRSKVPPLPQDSIYNKSVSHDRAPQGFEYDERAAYDGVWCYTSDQTINKCSRGFEDVKCQHAYLLFYEKLPTK